MPCCAPCQCKQCTCVATVSGQDEPRHVLKVRVLLFLLGLGVGAPWRAVNLVMNFWTFHFSYSPYFWPLLLCAYNIPGLPVQLLMLALQKRHAHPTHATQCPLILLLALVLVLLPLWPYSMASMLLCYALLALFGLAIGTLQALCLSFSLQLAACFPPESFAATQTVFAGSGCGTFVIAAVMFLTGAGARTPPFAALFSYFSLCAVPVVVAAGAFWYVPHTEAGRRWARAHAAVGSSTASYVRLEALTGETSDGEGEASDGGKAEAARHTCCGGAGQCTEECGCVATGSVRGGAEGAESGEGARLLHAHVPHSTLALARVVWRYAFVCCLCGAVLVFLAGCTPYLAVEVDPVSGARQQSPWFGTFLMYMQALFIFAGNQTNTMVQVVPSTAHLLAAVAALSLPGIAFLTVYPLTHLVSFTLVTVVVLLLSFFGAYLNASAFHLALLALPSAAKARASVVLCCANFAGYYVGIVLSAVYPPLYALAAAAT